MKKFWATSVSVLAIACGNAFLAISAQGADINYRAEPQTDTGVSVHTSPWGGFYIGGHLGGGVGDDKGRDVSVSGGDGGGGGGGGGDNNFGGNPDLVDGQPGVGRDGGAGGNSGLPGGGNNARRIGGEGGNGGIGGLVDGQLGGDNGLIGGVHLGYNWQRDAVVFGVEADASFHDGVDDYLASLRGRIGLAHGNWLLYLTGGFALRNGGGDDGLALAGAGGAGGKGGENDDDFDDPNAERATLGPNGGIGGAGAPGGASSVTGLGKSDGDNTGFVLGAGVETKLAHNLSAGFEGLHYSFGDSGNGDGDITVLRARLTLHLNRHDDGSFKDGSSAPAIANWSGFYLGGNAGIGFRDGKHVDTIKTDDGGPGVAGGVGAEGLPSAVNVNTTDGIDDPGGAGGGGGGGAAALVNFGDNSAFLAGIHIGFNWQDGSRVFGVEGDAAFAEDGFQDYLASLRFRLGYAFDRVMVYGTAGIAFSGSSGSFKSVSLMGATKGDDGLDGSLENNAPNANSLGDTNPLRGGPNNPGGVGGAGGPGGTAVVGKNGGSDEVGFVLGAGFDYKLSDRLSLGIEGLCYGFDGEDSKKSATSFSGDEGGDVSIIRARLSYHLQRAQEPLK
ncbi:MAG: hypothetical protein H7X92_12655 [Chitinophagales bacterium]|nr:hypothetical protein [Hyphomicrobiales bacterium]